MNCYYSKVIPLLLLGVVFLFSINMAYSITPTQNKLISDWWNWVILYNFTIDNDPTINVLGDRTGHNIMKFQPANEDVYFLTGTGNDTSIVRNVTIPYGKTIFVPIMTSFHSCGNCTMFHLFMGGERQKLLDASRLQDTTYLEVRLDNKLLPYDRLETDYFYLSFIDDLMWQYPTVSAGYWVTITPDRLPVGEHTLFLRGDHVHPPHTQDHNSFHTQVIYNLDIIR